MASDAMLRVGGLSTLSLFGVVDPIPDRFGEGSIAKKPKRHEGTEESSSVSLCPSGFHPVLRGLSKFDEADRVEGFGSDFELYKSETAAVVWVFGRIIFGILNCFAFFHAEDVAHDLEVPAA